MTHDIADVIKNLQTLSESNSAFNVLKDFERVIEELDVYVFKNWELGELIKGPLVDRHTVSCTFMWLKKDMPDPQGGKRLSDYGCNVLYESTTVMVPRTIRSPKDYRPGTKKGKIDAHPVWTVTIKMPKKLMSDVDTGRQNSEHNRMAEFMKYNQSKIANVDAVAQESPDQNAQQSTPM